MAPPWRTPLRRELCPTSIALRRPVVTERAPVEWAIAEKAQTNLVNL